jgi:hypothetical protein
MEKVKTKAKAPAKTKAKTVTQVKARTPVKVKALANANVSDSRLDALEKQVKALSKSVKDKEKAVQVLNDAFAINNLMSAYVYYLEFGMGKEIIECFSNSPDVSGTFAEGTYLGPEGIRRYFGRMNGMPPTFLHKVMINTPFITVEPDGKTAKGRWYGWGQIAIRPYYPQAKDGEVPRPDIDPMIMSVIYEMVFIKENGIWKILKLAFLMDYAYKPSDREYPYKPPAEVQTGNAPAPDAQQLNPDIWVEYDMMYPSGYYYPCHFKHPVTGEVTSEREHNAKLNLKPPKFRPGK